MMTNRLELVLMYWAAAKTGIVIVPMSTMLQAAGLEPLLNDSDSLMIIADVSFAQLLNNIRQDLVAIKNDRYISVGGDVAPAGFLNFDKFIQTASKDEPPDPNLTDNDVYNIMYSSGTTGSPKGIIHTHHIRSCYCTLFASSFRMSPESIILHTGALVFNGAMMGFMPWMYLGCRYILHETYDPKRIIEEIESSQVTHIILVPSQIVELLNHQDFDPSRLTSLEMITSLGAPLLMEYKNKLNQLLPNRFYELYGLTEGFITCLDKNDALQKPRSVGVPLRFLEMKIVDTFGSEVASGEVGEICGRGPLLTPGYYDSPDLTKQTIVDGWLHTGDAGYTDDDGFLYLVDRIKDIIISGGINIYPKDIEEIIVEHPLVAEVAVFGVPHDKWGEVPIAAVTLFMNAELLETDLVSWINERVAAKFQRVLDCFIMANFPRNVAGKTLKRDIRDIYLNRKINDG